MACYTTAELVRLHRRFGNPSASKLHNLLMKKDPEEVNKSTFGVLQEIERFASCARNSDREPVGFDSR